MRTRVFIFALCLLSQAGCSTKFGSIAMATVLGGGVGAGLGYTVIHSGNHQQYRTQNTIISASIFAATFGLATWYHLSSLDEQKIEMAGKFSRSTYLDRDVQNASKPIELRAYPLGQHSIKLDDQTRWMLPEFEKHLLPPERNDDELIVSHEAWQIVHPGYFVTKDQDSNLFKEEDKNGSK